MPLDQVKRLLDAPFSSPLRILEERLAALAEEIRHLRRQQRLVLRLLETEGAVDTPVFPNKESWSAMLREAGLDESGLHALHALFRREGARSASRLFGFSRVEEAEIERIRKAAATFKKTEIKE
jgi:hypothetical protein